MCPPRFFDVTYAINPWMRPELAIDRDLALVQWSYLVDAYRAHGHQVDELEPVEGLVDMVFAANGATVVDGRVLPARFATAQRQPEATSHVAWHAAHGSSYGGTEVPSPTAVNEAEGDFAVLADRILAGYGFRTTREAHLELARVAGREVVSLKLIDPRFYHLDVALTVLDDEAGLIAYFPDAFSTRSRWTLERLYPDAIIATESDALVLGLNGVSDGRNVFVPSGAGHLIGELQRAGFVTIPIDLSELIKSGGSVKCCTQEIRPRTTRNRPTDTIQSHTIQEGP